MRHDPVSWHGTASSYAAGGDIANGNDLHQDRRQDEVRGPARPRRGRQRGSAKAEVHGDDQEDPAAMSIVAR